MWKGDIKWHVTARALAAIAVVVLLTLVLVGLLPAEPLGGLLDAVLRWLAPSAS